MPIHVPPMPNPSSTNGSRPQTDAPIAARRQRSKNCRPLIERIRRASRSTVPVYPKSYLGTEPRGRDMSDNLTIGRLAQAAGVKSKPFATTTGGLLDEPPKRPIGQRCYSAGAAMRVHQASAWARVHAGRGRGPVARFWVHDAAMAADDGDLVLTFAM